MAGNTYNSAQLSVEILKLFGVSTDLPISRATIYLDARSLPRVKVTYAPLSMDESNLTTIKEQIKTFKLIEIGSPEWIDENAKGGHKIGSGDDSEDHF